MRIVFKVLLILLLVIVIILSYVGYSTYQFQKRVVVERWPDNEPPAPWASFEEPLAIPDQVRIERPSGIFFASIYNRWDETYTLRPNILNCTGWEIPEVAVGWQKLAPGESATYPMKLSSRPPENYLCTAILECQECPAPLETKQFFIII